jgi:hypothetical protein
LFGLSDYVTTTPLFDSSNESSTSDPAYFHGGVSVGRDATPFLVKGCKNYYVHMESITAGTTLTGGNIDVRQVNSQPPFSTVSQIGNAVSGFTHSLSEGDSDIAEFINGNVHSGLVRLKNPYPINLTTTATQGTASHVYRISALLS